MKETERFLNAYKALETAIKETYKNIDFNNTNLNSTKIVVTPITYYEGQLPQNDAEKLRYCRLARNFIQHNPEGKNFVCISEAMISFIKDCIIKVESVNGTVKDKYVTLSKSPFVNDTDTLLSVAEKLSKGYEAVYVFNKKQELVGEITGDNFIKSVVASEGKPKSIKAKDVMKPTKIEKVDINYPLMKLGCGSYIVCKNEKVYGFIKNGI